MSNVAERIKKRRQELGYSVAKLAGQLGVTPQAVFNWESQVRAPAKAHIPKLAELLGLRVEELLGATEAPLPEVSMTPEKGRLALADAMQLHDERVRLAIEECRRLRAELDRAEARQREVMQARDAFKRHVGG